MPAKMIYCPHCEQPVLGECVVVSIGDDFIFFHEECHQEWLEEAEAERHRTDELWQFFG